MPTFSVSDVKEARELLPNVVTSEQLEKLKLTKLEAYAKPQQPYVECLPMNGLLMAIHLAYTKHYPLVLSPDHIWICIAQGLARHINENAESLRDRLVQHQDKIKLEVRRDSFKRGSRKNDWPGVFSEFSDKLKEHLGERRDLFVCDFSTTDDLSRAVSSLVLMGAVQKYFSYHAMTLCGIPKITLEGTLQDWQDLRIRAENLREFDLSWWLDELLPVLHQFEAAIGGSVDVPFWQELYKYNHGSGGDTIAGWVNAFFPYLSNDGDKKNPWFEQKKIDIFARPLEGIETLLLKMGETEEQIKRRRRRQDNKMNDFPCGLTTAPFTWSYLQTQLEMSLIGGFFGVTQDEDLTLRPQLSWAIIEGTFVSKEEEEEFRVIPEQEELKPLGYYSQQTESLPNSATQTLMAKAQAALRNMFPGSANLATTDLILMEKELQLLEQEIESHHNHLIYAEQHKIEIEGDRLFNQRKLSVVLEKTPEEKEARVKCKAIEDAIRELKRRRFERKTEYETLLER